MVSLRLSRRLRHRLALLVLLCLLFQQASVAAYACSLSRAPAAPAMMMVNCTQMAKPTPQQPVLCQTHCHPDNPTLTDAKGLHVPPLALPPLSLATHGALLPATAAQHYRNVPVCRSDPPPTLRFCSLLI